MEDYPSDPDKNRLGDLTSGVGAVALCVGLALLGSPLLAASSGFLHAAGKLGSAVGPQGDRLVFGRRPTADNLYRGSVVLSRIPAFWITASQLVAAAAAPLAEFAARSILPATMLVCYGLWAAADIILLRGSLRRSAIDLARPLAFSPIAGERRLL